MEVRRKQQMNQTTQMHKPHNLTIQPEKQSYNEIEEVILEGKVAVENKTTAKKTGSSKQFPKKQ